MYLSVSFIQMLKALMPVAVFTTGCVFGIESFSAATLFNMVRAYFARMVYQRLLH